jgi:hypothetical protein
MTRQLPEGDSMADHYCDRCGEAWRDCACDERQIASEDE